MTFEIFIQPLRFDTPWVRKNGFYESVCLSVVVVVIASFFFLFFFRGEGESIYARCVGRKVAQRIVPGIWSTRGLSSLAEQR